MTEASSEESAAARLKEQPWSPGQKRLLTVVAVAVGMAGIDTTIVNVALPRMSTDLSLSLSGMQWVVDGYSLVYGASLLAAGVLADRIGFRKVFGIGVLAFALASMLITIAQTPGVLIGARAVQGLAAAVLTASGLAQLTAGFTGGQRARALGIYTTVGSVSFVVGPLLGGVLVDGPGWRWAFLINLPISMAVLIASRGTPGDQRNADRKLDLTGLLLASAALFFITYCIISVAGRGWGDAVVLGSLIAAIVLFAVFILAEHRLRHPLVDLSLFRQRNYSGALVILFAVVASFFGLMTYLGIWFQQIRGYSALAAGSALLPIILPFLVTAPWGGKLLSRYSTSAVTTTAVALTLLGLLPLTLITTDTSWLLLGPAFVLLGAGGGLCQAPIMAAALGGVPVERAGLASGIANSMRPLGVVVGVAALGTLLSANVHSVLGGQLGDMGFPVERAAQIAHEVAAGRIVAHPQISADLLRDAFSSGLSTVVIGSIVFSVVAAVLSVKMLPRQRPE